MPPSAPAASTVGAATAWPKLPHSWSLLCAKHLCIRCRRIMPYQNEVKCCYGDSKAGIQTQICALCRSEYDSRQCRAFNFTYISRYLYNKQLPKCLEIDSNVDKGSFHQDFFFCRKLALLLNPSRGMVFALFPPSPT